MTAPETADWRSDRIGSALRGGNPTVLRRLEVGFAVFGDTQFLPGCSVLLVDDPGVQRLYPRERWTDKQHALGPQREGLRHAIGTELDRLTGTASGGHR